MNNWLDKYIKPRKKLPKKPIYYFKLCKDKKCISYPSRHWHPVGKAKEVFKPVKERKTCQKKKLKKN
jgi:hypothetical protein